MRSMHGFCSFYLQTLSLFTLIMESYICGSNKYVDMTKNNSESKNYYQWDFQYSEFESTDEGTPNIPYSASADSHWSRNSLQSKGSIKKSEKKRFLMEMQWVYKPSRFTNFGLDSWGCRSIKVWVFTKNPLEDSVHFSKMQRDHAKSVQYLPFICRQTSQPCYADLRD